MPLDGDADIGIARQPLRLAVQDRARLGIDVIWSSPKWIVFDVTERLKSASEPGTIAPSGLAVAPALGSTPLPWLTGAGGSTSGRFLAQPAMAIAMVATTSVVLILVIGLSTPYRLVEPPKLSTGATLYWRSGPQAGSDPSSGVGMRRSFTPVRSTIHTSALPDDPCVERWKVMTRPLGDQLGPSSCQLLVSSFFAAARRIHDTDPERPASLVKAIRSPRGLHTGVA